MDSRKSIGTFLKCDMHVHSSSCSSRKYGKAEFFNALLVSDLDVIAITDHNVIDADLLIELHQLLARKGKTLIGGVELNIRLKPETIKQHHLTLGKGPKGDYFHAIVWYDLKDATSMANAVYRLFNSESSLTEEGSAKVDSLQSLDIKSCSKMFEGKSIFLEDFLDAVSSVPHFFIPHENKDRSLSNYLPNQFKANLEYKDRLFYYSDALAVEGGSKSRKGISEGMAKELGTTVAALFFSDAQSIEEIGSRFTWIDFDGDFDSLLLALSDPESRIRTSDECPLLPQTNTSSYLESIAFDIKQGGSLHDKQTFTLSFSPGYNGIVGSRGSGKTMLASLLSNKGIDTYSKFVDSDSIRYKMCNGVITSNRPRCLFLGQGDLEKIYKDGKYEGIPFLDDRVSPLRERAEAESEVAANRIEELLSSAKKLISAFCLEYDAGAVRIDHLSGEVPSGITIEMPSIPASDGMQISAASDRYEKAKALLANARRELSQISWKASYPENEELFGVLESESLGILNYLNKATERLNTLTAILEEINPGYFSPRDELLSLLGYSFERCNGSGGSATLAQYQEQTKMAATFLDDFLSLRISLGFLDEEAQGAYEKMHAPVKPEYIKNGTEIIEIALGFDDDSTYGEKLSELIGGASNRTFQVLAEAFIRQSDRVRMHKLFNGRKFTSVSSKGLLEHFNKFCELAKSSLCKVNMLAIRISVDGSPIDGMSPGMKAQALLKLFLNDSVISGDWDYIVLDQPEDNLDVATIKNFLISRIKALKCDVQFFVVSHSAPVVINGDARTIVVCKNEDKNISYESGAMNEQAVKQSIADVLDGGERYLKMRLNKYNFKVGDQR